ncbi:hypothetical protein DSM104299_04567 [Baekduia alba]|uniref:hypothetical protein n=1 Tax=Baekduia alba TaxID=2997333 RepID=UPI002341ABBD|nr:hypothetical protein [Baekduia alba]WCB95816.1 hypothetical protein DSM104299_04567 [Baekduia alba]
MHARITAAAVCATALLSAVPAGASTVSLGPQKAARGKVTTPTGTARAILGKARTSAAVTQVRVLVSAPARARSLSVGIYADRSGHPGRRLTVGRTTAVKPGWRLVTVPQVQLVAGHRYWVAVLTRGGALRSRAAKASCRSERSASRHLTALPATWRSGASSSRCMLAAGAVAPDGAPGAGDTSAAAPAPTVAPAAPAAGGAAPGASSPGLSTPPPPTASLPPVATLGAPSAAALASAKSAPFIRYGRSYPGGADTSDGWGGGASMVLATASYAGDTSADARLLAHIRDLVAGGNEPVANGGYPAQHERWVEGMLVLARRTPRVWNQLSESDRRKVDLVMTGALVGSAFTTSDSNPYVKSGGQQVTLDGDTDVNRDWNPNYREGMIGMMVVGAGYFGGGVAAQSVLDNYDAASFLSQLKSAGLTNQAATFSWKASNPSSAAPSAATVQAAVRGYRYKGLRLDQDMALARNLTENTYNAKVACGLNNGAGISTSGGPAGVIVSGCSGLANKGATGELQELDGVDGGGVRSSALYGYDGFRTNQNNAIVMLATGLWQNGTEADAVRARLKIGVPDLWYKLSKGYRGYASGSLQYIPDAPSEGVLRDDNANFSFPYSRTLWDQVLRPALGL